MVYRIRIYITLLLSFMVLHNARGQNDSVDTRLLQDYMWRYPQSQLRDVYKFCFQDYFGLEHIMSDSIAAIRYIESEIANTDPSHWQHPPFVYPLTLKGDYVRVDINYVRLGVIPIGTLVSAMLHSNRKNTDDIAMLSMWKERWSSLLRCLEDVYPRPLNFESDREYIDKLLSEGGYALHHSELFNKTYQQHYRIVRRDVFIRLLAPLLNK